MKHDFLKTQTYLIVVLILAYALLTFVYYQQTREYAQLEAEKKIENYLLMHKAIHGYVEEIQKPAIYKLKAEGKLYPEFFTPELLSFTFIARNIMDFYNKEREKNHFIRYYFKLASDNPRNDINAADQFELQILSKMNNDGLKKHKQIIEEDGKKYLYYALPVAANKDSCMKCHGLPESAPKEMVDLYGDEKGFNESLGHIRAMISMKAPLQNELNDANKVFYMLSGLTLAVLVFIYMITGFFIRQLEKKDILIKERNKELEDFNKKLEKMVSEETAKRMVHQGLLIQQSKMASMGEMTAAIAHQWKQPLNALSLIIDNIQLSYTENELTPEDMQIMSDEALNQVQYMSQTIEDFRHFYKPDKDKADFNIRSAMEDVRGLLHAQLKKSNINVICESTTESISIYGNKNEFMQVILNLMNNAADAIQTAKLKDRSFEGTITCKVSKSDGKIHISVCDNAYGVPADVAERIFDAYFTTKQEGKGTGIGLYMSKLIVTEGLGGEIVLKNSDTGACFDIILPEDNSCRA